MSETQNITERGSSSFSLATMFAVVALIAVLIPVCIRNPHYIPTIVLVIVVALYWTPSLVRRYYSAEQQSQWRAGVASFFMSLLLLFYTTVIGACLVVPALLAALGISALSNVLPDMFFAPIGLLMHWFFTWAACVGFDARFRKVSARRLAMLSAREDLRI